jgi:hypothetical protein
LCTAAKLLRQYKSAAYQANQESGAKPLLQGKSLKLQTYSRLGGVLKPVAPRNSSGLPLVAGVGSDLLFFG